MKLDAEALSLRILESLLSGRESHILSTRAASEWIGEMQKSYLCIPMIKIVVGTEGSPVVDKACHRQSTGNV
jgi:hypothetical protein